ncbi:hypothetical protein [Kribbella speibonae]|uniref:Uncharacterized protein n=1 Tax=Kribbella speibonae TaxID=1572660 RepID=A0ABY2AH51_9ACTN|nr:hypothetical protein [Kribbella speibonae]TCC27781.1 hypothetical protein E0H58_07525 [Kribbella speibonae]
MMIRRIIGLGSTTALAVTAPLLLTGAAPANAATTSCSQLQSAKNLSAVTYADRLVRAWGRADTAATNCYASTAAARTLYAQTTRGGIHWRRVSTEGAAGTIYVTYHDDARGGNLTIGVQNVGLRSASGWHAAYTAKFANEPKAWNAVQWSDNLVRAWGRGDANWTAYYATPRAVQQLHAISAKGGAHWRRISAEGAAGTTYTTYKNDATGHMLRIGISHVALSDGDAHAAYTVQYW